MSELLYRESFAGSYDVRLVDGHCTANVGIGKDWFTIYFIETALMYRRQGEATRLINEIKSRCAATGRTLKVWQPMSEAMESLCKKLNLETI